MIIDKLLQVSHNQTITTSAASTNVIDFGQTKPNTGMDDRCKMVVTVAKSVDAASPATVTFSVQDSADNSTFTDVITSGVIDKASLIAGLQMVMPMPTQLRRYCRVYYKVANGPLTSGKFSAQVVTGIQQNEPYPDSPHIA